jgi:hypothetical protein
MSEELLNSLFKVINEKSVSGSYDEKVNRLKRSGVLSDSQDFTCHQTLNKFTYDGASDPTDSIDKETSEKLANFFPDGTYNYTLIMFPTVVYQNGDAGNGTCQITSQYDVNTQGLVQKLFYHNYQSSVNNILPITSLNTLDIYSNFNFISSLGSSATGKYIINDNTCTIIDYGYSVASGGFTKFKYTFIKTGIGFISTTYVLNPDDSETLRTVAYYTNV